MWKCNPLGWLWGLPLLALLWLLVFFGERRNIEADLGERVTTTLREQGLDWARAEFSGRDGVLRGTARSVREQDNAVALAEKTWGVRILAEDTNFVRSASPYTWSATKEGNQLILDGYVPGREDKKAVLDMARRQFPDADIVDNMQIASGAPDRRSYMETVGFGLKQLKGFKYGKVGMVDRKFNITGLARDAGAYDNVRDAIDNELPVDMQVATNRVKKPDLVIPLASPFRLIAQKEDNTLKLAGHVHSARDRSDILAAARKALPDYEMTDNLEIAKGEPTHRQWLRAGTYGFKQLALLEKGSMILEDHEYSIRGHAASPQNHADITKSLKHLPKGFRLGDSELSMPKIDPYVWRADYHANRLTLSGHVPDRDTQASVKARAKRHFPNASIVDKMEVGLGAPDRWSDVTDLSLTQLARLENGNAMIWNREIEVRGRASSADRRTEVIERMKNDKPSDYQFFDEIRVPDPEPVREEPESYEEPPKVTEYKEEEFESEEHLERDVCQSYLDSILASSSIHFATASAKLKEESFATMTRLAHTANRCPETRIEIAGHTDADGSRKFNEFLSLRRARSVVKYLSDQGVSKDRLSAVGYGEARPLVPNNSDKNKARNRRIEFVVKRF